MSDARILVLEDVAFRYDFHRSLACRRELELRTARSGWEFVVSATHRPPDLMVLDHWMPDMLGDEVLDQIRRQKTLTSIPVVMLASDIGTEARRRCEALAPVLLFAERPTKTRLLGDVLRMLSLCHRRQARVSIRLPVQVGFSGKRIEGVTRDVSTLGASIEVPLALKPGERLQLTFWTDPEDPKPVGSTPAIVQHASPQNGGATIGVEFIEPTAGLRDFLEVRVREGQQLGKIISQLERLPALPAVTAKVLEESLKEDADLKTIISLIRSDPSMTGYLLKIANAAAYRFSVPVTTVERAVTLMGLKSVRNALLGFSIFRHLSRDNRDSLAKDLWRHSVACGLACELLAPRFEVPPEEAFTLGLLHDAGKFLLLSEFVRTDNGFAGRALVSQWSTDRERELFGMNHAEIGAAILRHWRVPEQIHQVVAHHHLQVLPEHNGDTHVRAVRLVRAADYLTYTSHLGVENGINDGRACLESIVQADETEELRSQVFRELTRIGEVFGEPVEPADLCAEIVERANLRLSTELEAAEERNELLQRAYERTRKNLVSLVQGEKYHALGRIARGVSHEINNPLGYAISNVTTLRDYAGILSAALKTQPGMPRGAEVDEILQDLPDLVSETLAGLLRVSTVVQSLKHFHLDASTGLETASLATCLQEALALVKPSLPSGISVSTAPGEVRDVKLDVSGMVRVFVEIIQNAITAMPESGQLDIHLREESDHVVATFRDTGEGISEENIRHVFEPFFTTRPVGTGRGLGLSVAYGIVSHIHGQILIGSTPGQGTVVEVRLPVDPPSAV